jgi:hypothetical protein
MPGIKHEAVVQVRPSRKVAVIAEVQKDRPDRSRELAWPAYACVARLRHECDVVVLVIGITRAAVGGSAKRIRTGHPRFHLEPLVTGHGRLPSPGGPAFAPELTLLNVITGDLDMTSHEARMLALVNLASAPPERRSTYTRYIRAVIPPAAREALEELMKTVIKDPFIDGFMAEGHAKGLAKGLEEGRAQGLAEGRAEGLAEGRAEGEAQMLLRYLISRFTVPASIRDQVAACTDTGQLEAWLDGAMAATTLDEIFPELYLPHRWPPGSANRRS